MSDERSTGWELVADLMAELDLQFADLDERLRYNILYAAYKRLKRHIDEHDETGERDADQD